MEAYILGCVRVIPYPPIPQLFALLSFFDVNIFLPAIMVSRAVAVIVETEEVAGNQIAAVMLEGMVAFCWSSALRGVLFFSSLLLDVLFVRKKKPAHQEFTTLPCSHKELRSRRDRSNIHLVALMDIVKRKVSTMALTTSMKYFCSSKKSAE